MFLAAAAISFGWGVHMYARAAFYPITGAFMGNGAEVFIPGFDKLLVMERFYVIEFLK